VVLTLPNQELCQQLQSLENHLFSFAEAFFVSQRAEGLNNC
jgi:hypothetical protein